MKGIRFKNLKNITKRFKAGNKLDLDPSLMKSHFFGTPTQRGKMVIYNLNDGRITYNVFGKQYLLKLVQMIRVNYISFNDCILRGQQIRIYAGLLKWCKELGFNLSRPYYHPILDSPIFETEEENKKDYTSLGDFEFPEDADVSEKNSRGIWKTLI